MFTEYCKDYRYVCTHKKHDGCYLLQHIYSFTLESPKRRYIVEVEEYLGKVFILKYYQKRHSLSKNKYTILTGENRATRIISTVFLILYEILALNPLASFAFMGAPTAKEEGVKKKHFENKRLRVYKKFLHNRLGEETFEFLQSRESSIYFLKNRKSSNLPDTIHVIGQYLLENYQNLNIEMVPVPLSSQSG